MNWSGVCGAAIAAFLSVSILTGCGGGDGGGGGETSSDAASNLAPSSVVGQVLTLNGPSAREITFDPAGNTWREDQSGTFHGGTYEYTASGNSAELNLFESGMSSGIRLTFSSENSGAYIAGQAQGTFQLRAAQDEPEEQNPSPNDPGSGVTAPASLDGRTMHGTRTFTSTGPNGQTHVYTFAGSSFHDSDPPEESDGTYIYEPAGHRAVLTLLYASPRGFDGDKHRLEMTFVTETSGTFESVYTRRDGTTIQIDGTFQIE
jgi:hypothetical protein